MVNLNGDGDRATSLANSVIATLAARAVQLIGIPVILAIMWGMWGMMVDSHDRLLRIEQGFMDRLDSDEMALRDHEHRLREIEQHRN